jgi:hypothetical protein
MFNSKSRFSILTEEKNVSEKQQNDNNDKRNNNNINKKQNTDQQKFNNFKQDRPRYETANVFLKTPLEKQENKIFTLSTENFPELVSVRKKETQIDSTSFLEKAKKEEKEEKEELVKAEDNIPYGCVLIKRCTKNNKMILKYDQEYESEENYKKNQKEEKLYEDEIIKSLVILHLKRKQEYIDNWGQDEYESTFLFPYYDYNYFDKLDAIYEEEIERLREKEEQEENNNELINYEHWRY